MMRLAAPQRRHRHPLLHSLIAVILIGGSTAGVWLWQQWLDLPDISNPEALLARQSIVITDRDGSELYRYYTAEDRTNISSNELPQHTIDAIVSIEDKRFFSRRTCIDIRALVRAALANVTDARSQGASTITQQLVRTAVLSREKTIERKVKELLLACRLEQLRSRDDILTLYLNWIHFGHGIAGIEQAAQKYFGHSAAELTLAESAVLAAMPQRPSYFSPYGAHRYTGSGSIGLIGRELLTASGSVFAVGRADIVLDAMRQSGFIRPEEATAAAVELQQLTFSPLRDGIRAPHFVLAIRDKVQSLIDEYEWQTTEGLQVQTTIDSQLQALAEQTVQTAHSWLTADFQAENIALLAVDRASNEIVAYVGSADFFSGDDGQIDMVRVPRAPGSSFKPFVYATLFENTDFTPTSYIYDSPLSTSIYRPHNYKSGYYGRMTIASALGRSRNVPAINAFYLAGGEEPILQLAAESGIRSPLNYKHDQLTENSHYQYGWPLALGTGEASLLEMVTGYSVLANEGQRQAVIGIQAIKNQFDDVLYTPGRSRQQTMNPQTAAFLTEILSKEENREPLWRGGHMTVPGQTAAVKTGTSNLCLQRDEYGTCLDIRTNNTWAIGYTDKLVVGVWTGNADNAPMKPDTSSFDTALPVWREFMRKAHENNNLALFDIN